MTESLSFAICISSRRHLVAPKYCITFAFNFSWVFTGVPIEIEDNAYAKCLGEGAGSKAGVLWKMCKWRVLKILTEE